MKQPATPIVKRIITSIHMILMFLGMAILPQITLICQEVPVPEYYGIYVVQNGMLYEFQESTAREIALRGTASFPMLGIARRADDNTPFISDRGLYFIVYGDKMNPSKGAKPSLSYTRYNADADIFMHDFPIALKIKPFPKLQDAYILIPEGRLEKQGLYCFHSGRLSSSNPSDASNESNAKNKDTWLFYLSEEWVGFGKLNKESLAKGQYTLPPSHGVHLIQKEEFVQIPITKKDFLIDYLDGDTIKTGIDRLSGITTEHSSMMPWFISFNEHDIRGDLLNVSMKAKEINFRDIIPERMRLSKIELKTVDTRTKKEIKKNEPPRYQNIYVEEINIPFVVKLSIVPTLCRIVPTKKGTIDSEHIVLPPGLYALHNGVLTAEGKTFGIYPIVYTFQIK